MIERINSFIGKEWGENFLDLLKNGEKTNSLLEL